MQKDIEKSKLYMKVNGEYKELGVIADIIEIEPVNDDEDYYKPDIPEDGFSMDFQLSKKEAKRLKNILVPKTKKEKMNLYNENKNKFRDFIKRK